MKMIIDRTKSNVWSVREMTERALQELEDLKAVVGNLRMLVDAFQEQIKKIESEELENGNIKQSKSEKG